MAKRLEIFVAVKGHPFDRNALEAMVVGMGMEPTIVDQPAAAALLNPDAMARYDAILFYDMPGLDFRAPAAERPHFVEPEPAFKAGFQALLDQGKGMVMMHHAIAGWPAWPFYNEVLGGIFLYKPTEILGRSRPESGYLGDVSYTARRAEGDHPVLAGLPERFDLTDELYLGEIHKQAGIEPLLYLDTTVDAGRFHSALHAVRGLTDAEAPWERPTLNPLLGWAKAARNSPLVYLQPGDTAATYADENYRLLLGNALRWVASPEGAQWAKAKASETAA
ncbi:MAG TPA: ThuA domain-containing protein [Sphingobium sp.]